MVDPNCSLFRCIDTGDTMSIDLVECTATYRYDSSILTALEASRSRPDGGQAVLLV